MTESSLSHYLFYSQHSKCTGSSAEDKKQAMAQGTVPHRTQNVTLTAASSDLTGFTAFCRVSDALRHRLHDIIAAIGEQHARVLTMSRLHLTTF